MMMLILLLSLLMVVLPLGQSFVFPPSHHHHHHHHHDVNDMNSEQQLRTTTTLFVANSEISDIHGSIDEEDLDITGPSTMHIASINSNNHNNNIIDYSSMTTLPRHPTNDDANEILTQTEEALRGMQDRILLINADTDDDDDDAISSSSDNNNNNSDQGYYEQPILDQSEMIPTDIEKESVYANSYVDLGKVNTVGFDYDYTLVTYTESLLELIYDMALKRLVEEKEYPREMMECGLKFDPFFSIRGEIVLLVIFKCVFFLYDTIYMHMILLFILIIPYYKLISS